LLGVLALLLLGVGSRLAFTRAFPTLPFSDFQALIGFGKHLLASGPAAPGWFWIQLNPGLPMLVALLFRVLPDGGPAAARESTAIWTGLLPLFPFLMWRGALSFPLRLFAGLLLALWPGQIAFSGVVAQDNWVLVPAVALASLAVRRLLLPGSRAYPVSAGLLYALAVAIRQEMLLVLLPLLAAAALSADRAWRGRDAARLLLAAGVPLVLLAVQRERATGRFALTTEHGGLALIGSFMPGAFGSGWVDPRPWAASTAPELLLDAERFRAGAASLALAEARRRPAFHALRIATQTARGAIKSDADNLFWSLASPNALPSAWREAGARLSRSLRPWLYAEMGLLQGLFAATMVLAFLGRSPALLVLGSAVFLKVALQAIVSPMSRLVVPATALELLAIPLAVPLWRAVSGRARAALALLVLTVPLALVAFVPRLQAAVERRDPDLPRRYRFPLAVPGAQPVWCAMDSGRLSGLEWQVATIETFAADPAPGDRARVVCTLPALGPGESLELRIEDAYSAGGLPGRMVERVEVDGREVLRHDIAAEPGSGWRNVPLASAADTRGRKVTIEILAVAPDRGWNWGRAAPARFEFVKRRRPLRRSRRSIRRTLPSVPPRTPAPGSLSGAPRARRPEAPSGDDRRDCG
jgi:hypothetical protein